MVEGGQQDRAKGRHRGQLGESRSCILRKCDPRSPDDRGVAEEAAELQEEERRAKLIHWVNRDGVDELYDLAADPYELRNQTDDPARAQERDARRRELARLVAEALGL